MEKTDWSSIIEAASGDVRRLDAVTRFSSIPVTVYETVSAHSFWVCLYAVMIHRRLQQETTRDVVQSNLREAEAARLEHGILMHAMTHDLGEAVTGDVVRTFKYSSSRLKEEIDVAEEAMVDRFPAEIKSLMGPVITNNDDSRYVKDVVKAADFMDLFEYMNREYVRGNRQIRPFLNRMQQDLLAMASTYNNKKTWYNESLSKLYVSMYERALEDFRMEIV